MPSTLSRVLPLLSTLAFFPLCTACGEDKKAATGADGGAGGASGTGGAGSGGWVPTDGGTIFESCFAGLDAGGRMFTEVQGFETADGAIRIWRARRPGDRSAVGETFPYDLVRFAVQSEDDVACVTAASALSYQFAHHNWAEVWDAETALYTYSVTESLSFGDAGALWADRLTVTTAAGAPVLGPVPLEPTGCFSIPYDLNPCMSRVRTDSPPEGFGE